MKPIDTSLLHRVILPEHSSAAVHPTLIMLHGRGADEEDLPGLLPHMDERLLVLSPRAPYPFGYGGYTWYDVGEVGEPEPAMFSSSYEKLGAFVRDALRHYPIDRERLFLFGFSMGTVMSYALGLSMPETFRGVLANSGYVPEGTNVPLRWRDLSHTGFFIAHGTGDPVIPVTFGRKARDLFGQSNADWTYHEYPMAHQISEESINDAAAWLLGRIAPTT